MEGETDIADSSIEQMVVVVPQPEIEEPIADEKPALRDRVPQKPPAYDAAGKIMPPRKPDGNTADSQLFSQALQNLNGNYVYDASYDEKVDVALQTLEDLAHDIYYGVELVKRSDVLQQLVLHMSSPKSSLRRHQAASIIGHSVQNNPTALKEIKESWKRLMAPVCGAKSKNSLGKNICEDQDFISKLYQSLAQESDPIASKAKVYALSGLSKDRELRDAFLAKNGMELLLSIFVKDGVHWGVTRVKIAQFVMDTFLDENMGAQLGIWPQEPEIEGQYCEKPEYAMRDGCWEYHLSKLGSGHPNGGDDWKGEFLKFLGEARGGEAASNRDEL
jgi:nucleotide exchange factor SIL1